MHEWWKKMSLEFQALVNILSSVSSQVQHISTFHAFFHCMCTPENGRELWNGLYVSMHCCLDKQACVIIRRVMRTKKGGGGSNLQLNHIMRKFITLPPPKQEIIPALFVHLLRVKSWAHDPPPPSSLPYESRKLIHINCRENFEDIFQHYPKNFLTNDFFACIYKQGRLQIRGGEKRK